MALSCTINNYWQCTANGDKKEWADVTEYKKILACRAKSSEYSYVTKIKFTTSSVANYYQSDKLILKVRVPVGLTITNPHKNACHGYLSSENYTQLSDVFDIGIDDKYNSAYGPGSALESNTIAESPVYTDLNYTTTTNTSSSSGGPTYYFIFDTTGLKQNTSYYLYFIRETNIYNGYFEANVQDLYIEHSTKILLDTPAVSTSLGTIAPRGKITVSWGEVSNTQKYNLTIKESGGGAVFNQENITATSYEATIPEPTLFRGKSLYACVSAVGSGQYTTSAASNKKIATFNSLPEKPTIASKSASTLEPQNSIIFKVTAGSDTQTEQTKTLYYSLNGGTTKQVFTSPLSISTTTTSGGGVKSGENKIRFYTYDGLEYSSDYAEDTFTANFAPVLKTVSTTHSYVHSMTGTSNVLVTSTKITFTLSSGQANSVKLYMKSGSSTSNLADQGEISSSFYSYNSSTKTITIPITTLTSLTNGHYFSFSIKVSDGTNLSEASEWQTTGRKPNKPRLPDYKSYNNKKDTTHGAIVTDGYYGNVVEITQTNKSNSAAYAAISSISIIAEYDNSSKEYSTLTTSGSTITTNLDLSQVNTNTNTAFKFKVVDDAGQTFTSSSPFLTLKKAPALSFAGTSVEVVPSNIKPLTNTSPLEIRHPIASRGTGSNTASTVVYLYKIKSTDGQVDINNIITGTSAEDIIIATSSSSDINTALNAIALDQTKAHSATVTITAVDGFGSTLSLTKNITINFTEPPIYITDYSQSEGKPRLYHDFLTGNTTIDLNKAVQVTTSETLDNRMFCADEGIILGLPKATDPNGDISEYQIYLSKNDYPTKDATIKSHTEVSFDTTPWITISIDTLTSSNATSDSYYYYYRQKAPAYADNKYYYFKVRVVDSTGNYSEDRICPSYFIGCRTVSPNFSVGNVKANRVGNTVTLSYDFNITDLGGSSPATGWDYNYYKDFKNFERSIKNYTYAPSATLKIEIGGDQQLSTGKQTQTITLVAGPQSGLYYYKDPNNQITFNNFTEEKLFMKFTLTVSYGLKTSSTKATVVSLPQIYTHFGSVPTVAHRAHKVGINTTSLGIDDVLVIENYQGTKYVVLKGTSAEDASQSYEIRINLVEGSISGTKSDGETITPYLKVEGAVVDCGSW